MADTYTDHGKLTKMEVGSHDTSWGSIINTVLDLIEEMAWGVVSVAITGDTALDTIPQGSSGDTRHAVLQFTGALSANANITLPSGLARILLVDNQTNKTLTVKYASGSTAAIPSGERAVLLCTGAAVFTATGTADNSNALGGVAAASYARTDASATFASQLTSGVDTPTPGSTHTPDASLANQFILDFTGASGTLANPTNLTDGQRFVFKITGASMTTLSFGSKFKWPGGVTPTFSGAGNTDVIESIYEAAADALYSRYFSDFS